MPYAVKQVHKDMWPAPYSKLTTWSWARSIQTKNQSINKGNNQQWKLTLTQIENSLNRISERLIITDMLIRLFNTEQKNEINELLNQLFNKLASSSFDLDPNSTYGHFNHYLLNSSFKYKIPRTTQFSDRLAQYIQLDPKINCGNRFYRYYIFQYFKADNSLSTAEKQAIEAMIENSPSESSQKACHYFLKKES